MSQQARDEAGNIWEIDAAGNPVRLIQQAGLSQPNTVVAPSPQRVQRQQAQAQQAALEIERLRKQLADMDKPDRGTIPVGYQETPDGRGIEPIPGFTPKDSQADAKTTQRRANLDSLVQQINRVQNLFNAGPGNTSGLAGLGDYFPTQQNRQFDAAAAGLAEQGLAAFRVPGVGAQSDTELRQFVQANKPEASDFDSAGQEKLRQLRARVDATRAAMGLDPAKWEGVPGETQEGDRSGAGAAFGANAGGQGGDGPSGPDRTNAPVVNGTGPNGGGGLALSQDGVQAVPDPVGQAAAARLNAMLKGGASDAEIANYAAQVGGVSPESVSAALRFRAQNPTYAGDYSFSGFEQKNEPIGFWRGFWNTASQSPVGAFAINAGNSASLNTLDNLTSNPDLARAGIDAVSANNPRSSLLGSVVGGALAAGGLESGAARLGATKFAPLIGDALFGAGSGAGGSDDGGRLLGAIGGATLGTIGGAAGRGVFNTASRAAKGVKNAAIDELSTRGIPLTLGQAVSQSGRTGQFIKGLEDAFTSIPGVGDMVNARRLDSMQGAERSAFAEAVEPLGQQYSGDTAERGVRNLKQIVSQGYGDALDPVRLQQDAQYVADIAPLPQQAADLPTPMDSRAGFLINKKVPQQFGPDGELTGNRLQQALRALRRERSNNFNQPNGADFADVANAQEDALTGLVQRQSPETMPALRNANEANKRVSTLKDAVNAARNGSQSGEGGLITMAQLSNAAAKTAKKYGGTEGTPDQPFFGLTSAARDVIPSRLPDSGTAKRVIVGSTLLGTGGGADYATGSDGRITGAGLTLGALLALGGSRQGQKLLTRAVLDRPDFLRRFGIGLEERAPIGGYLGAGAALPLLASGS
jgi:hypothetical protein